MQQPTGVIQMSTVHNLKTMFPASCENDTLSRHTLVLPKIGHSYPSRLSIGQSMRMLAPATTSIGTKGATRLFTHQIVDRKNKEEMIETP